MAPFDLESSMTASIQLNNRGCSTNYTEDTSLISCLRKTLFSDKQNIFWKTELHHIQDSAGGISVWLLQWAQILVIP